MVKFKKCKECKGTGWVRVSEYARGLLPCPKCNGSGHTQTGIK